MNPAREQHFGSDSVWRDPRRFLADFRHDLQLSPELAWQFFLRNLRARYRQSITGYVWAFVPPLAWAALFLFLRGAGQLSGPGGRTYAAFVIVGVVFWQLFIESAQTPLRIFADARGLLGKLRFPREALVLAGLLDVGLQFLIRLPLLITAWLLVPEAAAGAWWMLPGVVFGLVVAGSCVGLLLLPLSMLYQDVAQVLALASGFWLLITPVGYAAPTHGLGATLTYWNPATILIETARACWLGQALPAGQAFPAVVLTATVLTLAAWFAARVAFPHLIARFGS